MIFKGYFFSVLYAMTCLLLAFIIYKLGAPKKITRKIVHILVGFEWAILYHYMGVSVHFLLVCIAFLLILALSHRNNLMPMISSDGDNAPGTVYYALAMTIMATITLPVPDMILPFGIGVLCTSIGDGLAGIAGQCIRGKINPKIYGKKTLFGGIVNLLACFSVTFFFSEYFSLGLSLWQCVAIAALAFELELFTTRGLDNVTITLGTSFLAFSFINFSGVENYLLPILTTPLIIAFAYSKKALTIGGIIVAIFLDILISMPLGNFGFATLLAFFVGGIVLGEIKKERHKTEQNIEKRGECRDAVQVFANGFVAAVCAVLYFIFDNHVFVIAFVASLAEALADTTASSIGSFVKNTFDPFRMKKCQQGISGGMSIIGTIASLIASTFIAIIALIFGKISFTDSLIITAAGFLGGVFDSLLGSLLQIKYKCTVCDSIVEREEHCGAQTVKYSGIRFIDNDVVNFLSTLFAAIIAVFIYIL